MIERVEVIPLRTYYLYKHPTFGYFKKWSKYGKLRPKWTWSFKKAYKSNEYDPYFIKDMKEFWGLNCFITKMSDLPPNMVHWVRHENF